MKTDPYIAHCREDSKEKQSVLSHNKETALLAKKSCTKELMAPISYLAGSLHDVGKYGDRFQEYISQGEESAFRRGEVNHATAGGVIMEELAPRTSLSEVVQIAIYSHHGMQDAVDLESGKSLIEKRCSREYHEREKIEMDLVRKRFYEYEDKDGLDADCHAARGSFQKLVQEIRDFLLQEPKGIYGSRNFYMGMHERLLLSLLIDADRSNTARFMNDRPQNPPDPEKTETIWRECIDVFEAYRSKIPVRNKIDDFRREISDVCLDAASQEQRLYRLTLPTGSGKTLSSLRFALHHAERLKKQRIVYVAPFTSILEQNAGEIRKAVGHPEIVLEHHCNVVSETEEDRKRYEQLAEDWSSMIIATTAVQFLNTLFSSKTGCVRRMHRLCNSVVVFDEIQSLPVRTISLFNLAINYLTEFCNTTVVLCSATQPVFDRLPKNRLIPPKEMVEDFARYDRLFRRVTLIDQTGMVPGGMQVEDLGDFVLKKIPEEKQILVIVNTKACARRVYRYLKKCIGTGCGLFHLSTNMCVMNRCEVLKQMRACLEKKDNPETLICVSTQLIEAGVDLSFRCVVRSLAGLDNIIQAAGRCNRHGEQENGNVYIVKMSDKAEDVSRLPDIKIAQNAMAEVLRCHGDLLSAKAKEQYYYRYLHDQAEKVDFPVCVSHESTTLVDLLSDNKMAQQQYKRCTGKPLKCMMRQAFKTAGDQFEVISEEGKVNVVVEYDSHIISMLDELEDPYLLYERKKEILRGVQLASVGISEQLKNKLGRAITPICGGAVQVLSGNYYSRETGVSEEPVGMGLLDF